MSEQLQLQQFQLDQILIAIRNAIADSLSRSHDNIRASIRDELSSPQMIRRLDDVVEKYYKSNSELASKIHEFHRLIVDNQNQSTELLRQIIESKIEIDCPNNQDLSDIKKEFLEILNDDEYKLKQQIRDLKESGIARKIRNLTITVSFIIALVSTISGLITYFAVTANVTKTVSTLTHALDSLNVSKPGPK